MVHKETIKEIYNIEIGRNEIENDLLIKNAPQNSLWFHMKDMPSPHGILSFPLGIIPDSLTIYYIANLVKSYSKAKGLSKATVEYTEITNIKRTAKPGLVILKKKPKLIIV
jgi:predicted ribosome quality control (RQC) complex YloA/Tae2 family protein